MAKRNARGIEHGSDPKNADIEPTTFEEEENSHEIEQEYDLPSLDNPPSLAIDVASPDGEVVFYPPGTKMTTVDVTTRLTCEVPFLAPPEKAYCAQHVEVRLAEPLARRLKGIFLGLDHAGARLENGQRLRSHADVIRYLLERLTPRSEGERGGEGEGGTEP